VISERSNAFIMRDKQMTVFGLVGMCGLGLMVWLGFAVGSAVGQSGKHTAQEAVIVRVTAGKPAEFGFTLSKLSNLAPGRITFAVTNKGLIPHTFKICTSPVTSERANTCTGTATKVLGKGQAQSITVTLKKLGRYEYICTVAGHAKLGMKGLLGVGVKVAPSPAPITSTATTTPKTTTSTTSATCANSQTTHVTVDMLDFSFRGMPTSAPCGTLVITENNVSQTDHNIAINGQGGPVIGPGASSTFNATLTPGIYQYVCDVPGHAALGMVGRITITS
jgi:nitrite reductase (NO-forming)